MAARIVLVACAMACVAPSAHAAGADMHWCGQAQPHPLDVAFARAMQRSGGVTVDMRDAQGIAYAGWDAELNRWYREALRHFEGDDRAAALRAAQRAWLAWDRAEAASDAMQQADAGTAGPLALADLAIARRRARACSLHSMRGARD